MNAIANRYTDQSIGSYFLYTHEAHPGENIGHLTSFEQKLKHATLLRDDLGVTRPILVDALDGACHREYGSMPNMTWIFTRAGTPVYKSDWTDAASVENAVQYYLAGVERRREGQRLAPFFVQRLDFQLQDRDAFYQGLERNGPKAVEEFRKAFG